MLKMFVKFRIVLREIYNPENVKQTNEKRLE